MDKNEFSKLKSLGREVAGGYKRFFDKFDEKDIKFLKDFAEYENTKSVYTQSYVGDDVNKRNLFTKDLDDLFIGDFKYEAPTPIKPTIPEVPAAPIPQEPQKVQYRNLDSRDSMASPKVEATPAVKDDPVAWDKNTFLEKMRVAMANPVRD